MEKPKVQAETITAGGTLADRVTAVLQQKIRSGEFAADAHLPAESALAERFGVSRTVIREAVSRLKSEGLVATHQGKGTVVVGPSQSAPFRIDVDLNDSVQAVLRVMELRGGLEAEVAALAAERRTEEQNQAIQQALLAIDQAVAAGGDGVEEDVAFHTAISNATGNPLYTSLLVFLRQFLRQAVTLGRMNEARFGDVNSLLRDEHRAVADAIARQDVNEARAAARRHVGNVAARLRDAGAQFWRNEGGQVARHLARSEEQVRKHVGKGR
ncbi:MAG: FadR/GntR family transcriptional regulator [Massilia sp.]